MSVSSFSVDISYPGTGTPTTGPFSIPFPFLETQHVRAAIAASAGAQALPLNSSAYSVSRTPTGGELRLVTPLQAPKVLTIFRSVPLSQPTTFPLAGPFPAKAAETALDRLLMQVQELSRRVDGGAAPVTGGGGASGETSVLTWTDATARAATKPLFTGQLGVERLTQTVWISQGLGTGDWQEFRPRRTNRVVLGYVADAGDPGAFQTKAANLLNDWECDAVLFAGDNSYNPPTETYGGVSNYAADWAAFSSWIAASKAYPALGTHDVDYPGWEARHYGKFPYLPGNKRYYSQVLGVPPGGRPGDGLVELFVLNSGLNSLHDVMEPDGNAVESAQHQWFVSAVTKSTARWKIAMFHTPPVTLNDEPGRAAPEMAWPELSRMDLILCGHAHLLELLRWNETMLANLSAVVFDDGKAGESLNGTAAPTDRALWANDELRGLGRIVASQDRLEIEVWTLDGTLLHARNTANFSSLPLVREQWRVVDPSTAIGTIAHAHLTTFSAPAMVKRVMIAVAQAGAHAMKWTLHAGSVEVATGILGAGATAQFAESLVPLEVIPRAAQLWLSTEPEIAEGTPPDAKGLEIAIVAELFAGDLGLWSSNPFGGSSAAPLISDQTDGHTYRLVSQSGVLGLELVS